MQKRLKEILEANLIQLILDLKEILEAKFANQSLNLSLKLPLNS